MSFASHNPEKYDEIIRQGLLNYLDKRLFKNGFDVPGDWLEGLKALIETMEVDPQLKGLYNELHRLATVDIMKAEQDYFGGLADGARQ
jgi:hypothetical protein